MKVIPETPEDLTRLVAANFNSFGGGKVTPGNILSYALVNNPPSFAAGVDIASVVNFILRYSSGIKNEG